MYHTLLSLFATIAIVAANPINKCSLPKHADVIAVGARGWAMSPDEPCTPGKFCPFACAPGKLMNQWDVEATSYAFPKSMNGGLYCNDDGSTSLPFDNRPLCVDGEGTVSAVNKAGGNVAFCQTVLPGNEAMLIPTNISKGCEQTLAVPGPKYWAGTAAHYYVNTPGVSTKDACVWGSTKKAVGNWAPYVAGMNMDSSGNTFVTIGYNPKYIDDFNGKLPNFGIRIKCDNPEDCNGLDCEINPKNGFGKAVGPSSGNSLGADYCIVTARSHAKAKIEIFSK
ncbi:hypothetical protein SBY92_000165 [Candida maltosa Xu316]